MQLLLFFMFILLSKLKNEGGNINTLFYIFSLIFN
jgi:hypothetical protein